MKKNYLVVGNPIEQSKSPLIHTLFAKHTQQDMHYSKALVKIGEFDLFAKQFFSDQNNHGMNITMPFKGDAFDFAQVLTPNAQLAGAVNTLIKQDDNTILGENTDGIGLMSHIKDFLKWEIKNKNVLVLGAGGAVRGILLPLLNENPKDVLVVNRTESKAQDLVTIFKGHGAIHAGGFDTLKDLNTPFDIIINGTSTGLTGDIPPVPKMLINEKTCIYDMVYAKEPTPFMHYAKQCKAQNISDGLGMLVGQAAISFTLWRGVMPDVGKVMQALSS